MMTDQSIERAVAAQPRAPTTGTAGGSAALTYLLLAAVPVIWGSQFVALKVVFEEYTVLGLLSIRYVLMSVALLALLWVSEREMTLDRRDLPYLAVFSLLMVTVYQVVFAQAVQWAAPAESALFISTAPIFAALTAAALGWEQVTRGLVAGIGCGFAGIVLVVYGGRGLDYLPRTHVVGSITMLVAALMWAWYAVLAKPLLRRYSPLKVTAYCQTLGGVALVLLGLRDAMATTPRVLSQVSDPALSRHAWWVLFGLVYYALLSGAFGFWAWYRGVQGLGAGRTMLFQFCVPIVGLAAAIVFRQEYPSALQWVGAGLTIAGVFFTLRRLEVSRQGMQGSWEGMELSNGTDTA